MIDLLNSISIKWASLILTEITQNSVFISLIFLALYILRNSSAQIKYSLCLIGLARLLIPIPIFSGSIPLEIPQIIKLRPLIVSPEKILPFHPDTSLNSLSVLFLIWLLFITGYFFIFTLSSLKLSKQLKGAKQINDIKIKIPADVTLFLTNSIQTPLTFGLFSKKIFLPVKYKTWNTYKRNLILKHELTHIKRKDNLINLFQKISEAFYFFNPLIHILNKKINTFREMACDDNTAGSKYDSRIEYSKILINIAENMHGSSASLPAAAMIWHKNDLIKRINYQIKEKNMRKKTNFRSGLTAAVLTISIVILSWHCSENKTNENQPPPPPDNSAVKTGAGGINFVPHDKDPSPIGGYTAIKKNLEYPEIALKAGIEGTVKIYALINKKGEVIDTKIMKTIGKGNGDNGCAEAAVRAIKAVKWTPARQKEEAVRVWVMVPVEFKLK